MLASSRFFSHDPELAAIFDEPVTKRYGVVEYEEKPYKGFYRQELLKIYMRRNYPTATMRSDLVDSMNTRMKFTNPAYFQHPQVDKKENTEKALEYLQYLETSKRFVSYSIRAKDSSEYRHIIERMRDSLKCWLEELNEINTKADHIHFLNEMLFVRNLQSYPLPKRWIVLLAYYHNMPEYERLLAALRVITEYDGDRAPKFEADMFEL